MTYENGGQLDRALKKAVRDRGGDPGDGYRQALPNAEDDAAQAEQRQADQRPVAG